MDIIRNINDRKTGNGSFDYSDISLVKEDKEDELFPIVNDNGDIVGSMTRKEAHCGTKRLHPVVHLHLLDTDGNLYLQQRAAWKEIQPDKWDTAVGGHIDYGENADTALIRESYEELGLRKDYYTNEPERISTYIYESDVERELVCVYKAKIRKESESFIHPSETETQGGRFWDFEEIKKNIGKEIFTPMFEQEFKKISSLLQLTIILFMLLFGINLNAQTTFIYKGKKITSSAERLYVNDKKKTNQRKYTFSHISEALKYAEKHIDIPTTIYIEPSVYWLDDPNDSSIRRPKQGSNTPYALELNISNVHLTGLGHRPDDVVLAVNRGQTQGADGNFTMFHITGSNISAENITFGNYCNVDLDYIPDQRKSRRRRADAIVQAQIAICNGDNYSFQKCKFISRLNLCPFVGSPHTQYNDCYFECTDDALCGTGTYKNCSFTLFSSKPFYTTDKTIGAKFYDCHIHSKTHGTQYLTKVSGPVIMERCHWTSDDPELKIEWNKHPDPRHHCHTTDCTLNDAPLNIPTPTEQLPVSLPPILIQPQSAIEAGHWTIDCYKPTDTADYSWQADPSQPAWAWAEGIDGAEGTWGMVQVSRGARLMYTPRADENIQQCNITLCPCKSAGQGFGSATGQYLDICIAFDTQALTGYGLRFMRTPDYDHAVVAYLVRYVNGTITPLTSPERCDLFKPDCTINIQVKNSTLYATIRHDNTRQTITSTISNLLKRGGFHLQHTGSTGASATIIKRIELK